MRARLLGMMWQIYDQLELPEIDSRRFLSSIERATVLALHHRRLLGTLK